jgi:hypothetical protein
VLQWHGVRLCELGAVWFRGYHPGDGDIHNHLVRDNHFACLVESG